MVKFWKWFNDLEATDPGLRFSIFLTFGIFCLLVIPIICHFILGWALASSQWIGIAIMAVAVIDKIRSQKKS